MIAASFAQGHVHGLDGIGGVYGAADLLWE